MIATCGQRGVEVIGVGSHVPERVMTQRRDRDDGRDHRRVDRPAHRHPRAPDRRRRRVVGHASAPRRRGARSRAPASIRVELDLIVTATASPDYYFPATATLIGERDRRRRGGRLRPVGRLHRLHLRARAGLRRRSRPAWPRRCSWSAPRCSRGCSTGATARPASCSATARVPWCCAATDRPPRDPRLRAGLRRVGCELLVGRRGRAQHADHGEAPYVQMDGPEVYKFATTVSVDSRPARLDGGRPRPSPTSTCSSRTRPTGASSTTPRGGSGCPRTGWSRTSTGTATRRRRRSRSASTRPIGTAASRPATSCSWTGFGGGLSWGSCVMEWTLPPKETR